MQFSFVTRDYDGLSGLQATPGDYDGIPSVDSLVIGSAPERTDPNLVATAAALTFEAYIADEVSLQDPVLPQVADAISDFFPQLRVRCPNIEYRPRRISEGQGVIQLLKDQASPHVGDLKLGSFQLRLVDNFEAPRGFALKNAIYLPSNASVISPRPPNDTRRFFPKLGAVLLLAGELGAREIDVHGAPWSPNDPHLIRARELLRSVNRELTWN